MEKISNNKNIYIKLKNISTSIKSNNDIIKY